MADNKKPVDEDEVLKYIRENAVPVASDDDEVLRYIRENSTPDSAPVNTENAPAPTDDGEKIVFTSSILPFSKNANGRVSFDSNAGLLGAAKRAFMLPGEVMEGKVDPMSEEGIGRAFEFSSFATPARGNPIGGNPVSVGNSRLLRGAVGGAEKAAQRVDDFNAFGMKPTSAMISQNPKALAAEKRFLEAADPKITRMHDDIGAGLERQFMDASGNATSKQAAGGSLQSAARDAKSAITSRINQQYSDLDNVAGSLPVTRTNVDDVVRAINKERLGLNDFDKLHNGKNYDSALKTIKSIQNTAKDGMTFSAAQKVRSDLGEMAFSRDTNPVEATLFKRAYEALDKDMAATAQAAGDDVLAKWRNADAAYKSQFGPNGTDKVLNPIIKKETGEEVFNLATGKSKDGGSRLETVRKTIVDNGGEAAWNETRDTFFRRLGTKTVDDVETFDMNKFKSGWNQTSSEAKDVLLSGAGGKQARETYERIIRIDNTIQKPKAAAGTPGQIAYELFKLAVNKKSVAGAAGTALGTVAAGPVGGAVGGALGTGIGWGAGKIGNTYSRRLISNPETAAWIADLPRASMFKGGINGHIQRLVTIAGASDAPTQEAIRDYLRDAGYENELQNSPKRVTQ